MVARPKIFTLRMNEEEWERAQRLAGDLGNMPVAGLFRYLMKKEENEQDVKRREELIRTTGSRLAR